jgi:hypothetical protein
MAKRDINTQLDQLANFRGLLASPKIDAKLRERVIKSKVYDSRNKISAILVEKLEDFPRTADIVGDLNNILTDDEIANADKRGIKEELLSSESSNRDPAVRIIVEDKNLLKKKDIKGELKSKPIIRTAGPTKSNNSAKGDEGGGNKKPKPGTPYSSILLNIPTLISPKNLNLEKTLLFMDMIPTHELSRCVPYIDIRMISAIKPVINKKPAGLSLYKHIAGDTSLGAQTNAANLLVAAKDANLQTPESTNTVAGIELFTSPQTLAPLAAQGSTRQRRIASGGDIFRSFLTLTDISLNKSFSGGMIGFESGTMELVLHDRANLADVADLINPEYYSRVRFELTYGWSHPDEVNNVYGQLIKTTRQTGLFQITKTTYTLDRIGQVKITVNFAAVGAREITRIKISEADTEMVNGVKKIQELGVAIKELFSANPNLAEKTTLFKTARASQLITAAKNPLNLMATSSRVETEILKFINSINENDTTSPDKFRELKKNIKKVFGTGKALQNTRRSIDTMVADRVKSLAEGPDPWIDERLKESSFNNIINARKFFLEKRLEQLLGRSTKRALSSGIPSNITGVNNGLLGQIGTKVRNEGFAVNSSSKGSSKLKFGSSFRAKAAARLAVAEAKFAKVKNEAERIISQLKAIEAAAKPSERSAKENQRILQQDLKMVSLGKIINEFILKPLAMSGRFSEVQALYYPLNAAAGRAGQKWKDGKPIDNPVSVPVSIGSYLVDYSLFKEEFQYFTKRKGTAEIQVNEFLGFLFNKFTDDVRSWMYGLSALYAPRGAYPRKKGAVLKSSVRQARLNNARKVELKQVSAPDGYEVTDPSTGEKIDIEPGEEKEFILDNGNVLTIQNIAEPLDFDNAEFEDFDEEGNLVGKSKIGTTSSKPKPKPKKRTSKTKNNTSVNERQQYRMSVDEILNGRREPGDKSPRWKFRKPNVECVIETGTPRSREKGSKDSQEKPILRIHIYDRVASSYKTQQAILKEAVVSPQGLLSDKKLIDKIRKLIKDAKNKSGTDDTAARARKTGKIDDIPINVDTIKKFMYDTMPSLTFGTNNNIFLDAQLSSIDDGALETINISKNRYSPVAPATLNEAGVPLRVSQAILDATLIGCPTIDLVQQYFLDFGTNTTLDAIYSVSSVEHQFSPGKFNTRVKFVPNDGWAEFLTFRQAIGIDE